jgi:hypothetical protein
VLGPAWVPQTAVVLRVGAGDLPSDTTLAEWESEVQMLEFVAAFKDGVMRSVN